ncbi:spore germination protein [Geomicrobium sediminis]|uniref:Stage V sporulation protein AF n=1 Tax=Geomicrobium sediminis TaxID=1347788 RepID=A0ABS2PDS3_9BACL|nr:spore germination protein [Geomicrobium sediminis]MBM7633589.1 stage V sporulation protein AF [Geomicrobium sediminis]
MKEQTKREHTPLSSHIHKNEKIFKERLGMDDSFDVGVRKLNILEKEVQIYYCNGLTNIENVIEVLKELMHLDHLDPEADTVQETIENHLTHLQVEYTETIEDCIFYMLSGLVFILLEDEKKAFVVDVRNYPGRSPDEPDTERVVRGARDGYTENIIENTGLTRRHIRDENLRNEIMQIGSRSKTDICISYIHGVADPDLVSIIKKELEQIDIDGISMADKTIEEYLVNQGWNPFPLVRYTERPDVASTHLLEGHVAIIVDTSPSVIILPATFFHHVQHAEEFRQSAAVGTFLRWVRFIGIISSILIVPLWSLLVLQPDMIPDALSYLGPEEESNVPLMAQVLVAEFGIELLRMAAIHTPSPLATALGLVAALLIGDVAISVGLLTPEVILYMSLGAVGIFAVPSAEMGTALKMLRIVLIIATGLFLSYGLVIALTVVLILMAGMKPLHKPYLWPFLPFDPKGMWQIAIRTTVPSMRLRPRIVNPKDPVKQGDN